MRIFKSNKDLTNGIKGPKHDLKPIKKINISDDILEIYLNKSETFSSM